ncbi:hypothetical protein ACEQ6A_33985 [Rhizobium brockwellii]|uniref:hypothetical protein n=1 Tax=Rhizobium brockwellii TaxID=3019932 RepID=UPI003F99783C
MKLIYGSVGVRMPDILRVLTLDQWAIPQRGMFFPIRPAKSRIARRFLHTTTDGAGGGGGAHAPAAWPGTLTTGGLGSKPNQAIDQNGSL